MYLRLCLMVVVCYCFSKLSAQEVNVFIPQQYEGALKGKSISKGIEFFSYEYQSSKVDVRDMKKKYPNLKAEDFVDIIPPSLKDYSNVSILMAAIGGNPNGEKELLIWFIENYYSNIVTFYIDKNFDRNFLNDDHPIVLTPKDGAQGVQVFPTLSNKSGITLYVQVPKRNKEELRRILPRRKIRSKLFNDFVFGANLGFGVAKVEHSYLSTITNFPGWYDTNLTEKSLGVSLEKYFSFFKIGAELTYQSVFQYTSYFNLRTDEPRIEINNGNRRVIENVTTDINRDEHSTQRLRATLNAMFRLHLSRNFEVQAGYGYGNIYYLNKQYIADKFEEPELAYEQKSDQLHQFKVSAEFAVGNKKVIGLNFNYDIIDWKPVGFFESIEGTGLERNHNSINFNLSYKTSIF